MVDQPNLPPMTVPVNHVEAVPRRVRAVLGGQTVLDTVQARYVWDKPYFPQLSRI
jgi:predicted dinucleotide-binding enzyme